MTELTVELAPSALGLEAPPCRVHVKPLNLGRAWRLFIWLREPKTPGLETWALENLGRGGSKAQWDSDSLLLLRLERLPDAFKRFSEGAEIDHVVLSPEGPAQLYLQGSRDELQAVLTKLEPADVDIRRVGPDLDPKPRREPEITERQREILAIALRSGYYEIPRETTLREMAEELEMSASALSETLRRVERTLVIAYLPDAFPDPGGPDDGKTDRTDNLEEHRP